MQKAGKCKTFEMLDKCSYINGLEGTLNDNLKYLIISIANSKQTA